MDRMKTSEATVKTLAIQVKVMKIGNRQVTLSVFRQLQYEQIIDAATGQLRGVPWGRVNYCPGGCADGGGDHLHVVWQKGGELRRACVSEAAHQHEEAGKLLRGLSEAKSYARDLWLGSLALKSRPEERQEEGMPVVYLSGTRIERKYDLDRLCLDFWEASNQSLDVPSGLHTHMTARFHRAKAGLDKAIAKSKSKIEAFDRSFNLRDGHIVEDASAAAGELARRMAVIRKAWEERYKELLALDQLFVAV